MFKRSAALALAIIALGACTAVPPPPPPPPPPAPTQARPAQPPLPPEPQNWIDAPRSPGDWSYAGGAARTVASFGRVGMTPDVTLTCDWASRTVTLARAGASSEPVLMRLLTESTTRVIEAQPSTTGVAVTLSPKDPLLDALAFSRGRFALESGGMPTLYLPSWAEVTRVVEDCR